MSRDYNLTQNHKAIPGKFWIPGEQDGEFHGILNLNAGESPILESSHFVDVNLDLMTRRPPARRIIHGHDEHGSPITLLDCYSASSQATMKLVRHRYLCQGAIFGEAIPCDDLQFEGLQLYFDHQNTWINRHAFKYSCSAQINGSTQAHPSRIAIQVHETTSIPLRLHGYTDSRFLITHELTPNEDDFRIVSRTYLDITFASPLAWTDALEEVRRWRWFFSLAARSSLDLESLTLCRRTSNPDVRFNYLPVWIRRSQPLAKRQNELTPWDYYFTYDDIKDRLPDVIERWNKMQDAWNAVLHRFFATTVHRELWANEIFLFLAQAIESLHRARFEETRVSFRKAAETAWQKSPAALQTLLGDRDRFVNQLLQSRNFWTHYGKREPDVLEGRDLVNLSEKLRWVIEAAVLVEIGIPEQNVAKVWADRWRQHWVDFT